MTIIHISVENKIYIGNFNEIYFGIRVPCTVCVPPSKRALLLCMCRYIQPGESKYGEVCGPIDASNL